MKLILDTESKTLIIEDHKGQKSVALYSDEAFELLSYHWLKVGWNQKHVYTFSWMGRPIIQLPHDMLRIQEVIYRVKPDVIIEMGIAHGGSLVYYATLCKAMETGRVIGVDIDIRSHNRSAIEAHHLFPLITLVEGDSTDADTVHQVKEMVQSGETALVILDSNHSKEHVLKELEAYCDLVSPGSYIVVTDGLLQDLHDVPRGKSKWKSSNPRAAAEEFAHEHPEFVLEHPAWPFVESESKVDVTHWPRGWLRRL